VFLPAMYRDLSDGRELEPAELDAGQWRTLTDGAGHIARVLAEETGMRLVFHPHAESHVETDVQVRRFLAGTDPERVGLCLDTGHVAYTGGDARRGSSASTPAASGTSTSRPSIPACSPRFRPGGCRSPKPSGVT
jgi:hypothetical protein